MVITPTITCPRIRLFKHALIPGNHDVHRKECLRYFEQCVESGDPIVAPWYPKWRQYEKAFTEFYKDVPGVRFTPDQPWSLFAVSELEIVIAGLNRSEERRV